jgi:hypothetical protein
LPSGQIVAATLVRNLRTGKIVPVVQQDALMPRNQSSSEDERQPLQRSAPAQLTFPKTVVYRPPPPPSQQKSQNKGALV